MPGQKHLLAFILRFQDIIVIGDSFYVPWLKLWRVTSLSANFSEFFLGVRILVVQWYDINIDWYIIWVWYSPWHILCKQTCTTVSRLLSLFFSSVFGPGILAQEMVAGEAVRSIFADLRVKLIKLKDRRPKSQLCWRLCWIRLLAARKIHLQRFCHNNWPRFWFVALTRR